MPISASSRGWIARQARDPFVKQATAEGFRSRAAFKLLELQQQFRLIRHGDVVVDLGAAPGSWSQVAAQLSGSRAAATTVDTAGALPRLGGARAPLAPGGRPSIFDLPSVELDGARGDGAGGADGGASPRAGSTAARPAASSATSGARGGRTGGLVVAVDVLPVDPLPGVVFLRGDFTSPDTQRRAFEAIQRHTGGGDPGRGAGAHAAAAALTTAPSAGAGPRQGLLNAAAGPAAGGAAAAPPPPSAQAHVLLSDMAHSFTGEAHTDHLRQMALSWTALLAAPTFLRREGHLAVKVRYGGEYKPLLAAMQRRFRRVVEVKPPASRAESAEAFIVGLAWCGAPRALAASTPQERDTLAHFGLAWPGSEPVG